MKTMITLDQNESYWTLDDELVKVVATSSKDFKSDKLA